MNEGKVIQFLKESVSQKEVSLIVARDNDEFKIFHSFLLRHGYSGSDDAFEALAGANHHNKVCLIFNHHNGKILYDFVLQYPTGQVNLLDNNKMKNLSFSPKYEDHSIILLTTEGYLTHLTKNDLNFLSITGMVYRNKD